MVQQSMDSARTWGQRPTYPPRTWGRSAAPTCSQTRHASEGARVSCALSQHRERFHPATFIHAMLLQRRELRRPGALCQFSLGLGLAPCHRSHCGGESQPHHRHPECSHHDPHVRCASSATSPVVLLCILTRLRVVSSIAQQCTLQFCTHWENERMPSLGSCTQQPPVPCDRLPLTHLTVLLKTASLPRELNDSRWPWTDNHPWVV
jgi:hypothetical protein